MAGTRAPHSKKGMDDVLLRWWWWAAAAGRRWA